MIETINNISLKEFCSVNHLDYCETLIFITEQIKKARELLNRRLTPREIMEFMEMAKIYIKEKGPKELKLK